MQNQAENNLSTRQHQLLIRLVKRHIASAQPISSQELVGKGVLDCSPATVRNDLTVLEDQGYVWQPHTSAGRVPTELGYTFYVSDLRSQSSVVNRLGKELAEMSSQLNKLEPREAMKLYARTGTQVIKAAAYVAFDPSDYYYTGLSVLFNQPEFGQIELVCSMADVLDHLGNVLQRLWQDVNGVKVQVGSQCYFGQPFATVVGRTRGGILFGVLGPQRLDYEQSLGLVNHLIANF